MATFRLIRPFCASLALHVAGFSICIAASGIAHGQATGQATHGQATHGQTKGGPTPSPAGAAVYFIDLKNGDTLPPDATIRFGLHGMGIAPAGSDRDNSGHHHLLIDAELPALDKPIPNDFNHLHFGAGQTEAEVSLTPGEHTLQLLLGDKSHIPHSPPVMSDPIRIRVVDPGAVATAPESPRRHSSSANAKVYFVDPADGDYVSRTLVIHFGLLNMGVAPAGVQKANTGHHHLLIDTPLPPLDRPIPNDFNHLHFGAGQTEAQITLRPGTHRLQLLLGDENHMPHVPAIYSKRITVIVTGPGRRVARPDNSPAPSVNTQ
jgi:hypothetical protein